MMLSLGFWQEEEKKVKGYDQVPEPPKNERRDSGLGFDPLFDPPISEVKLTQTQSSKDSTKIADTTSPKQLGHRRQSSWFNFTVERMTRFFSSEDDESFYAWVQEQNLERYGPAAVTPSPVERVLDGVVDYLGIGEITMEPEPITDTIPRKGFEDEREVLFDVQEIGEVMEAEKKASASSSRRQSRRMSSGRFPPVTIMADEYM